MRRYYSVVRQFGTGIGVVAVYDESACAGYGMVRLLGRRYVDRCCSCCFVPFRFPSLLFVFFVVVTTRSVVLLVSFQFPRPVRVLLSAFFSVIGKYYYWNYYYSNHPC